MPDYQISEAEGKKFPESTTKTRHTIERPVMRLKKSEFCYLNWKAKAALSRYIPLDNIENNAI